MIPENWEGCWFDCTRGIYQGELIQRLADHFGWTGESVTHVDAEEYWDATNEAEEFLSELIPEGFHLGTNEGLDFGMWRDEE